MIIPPKTKVTNAISNGKYTVWHEDYRDTNIYVYDHSLDELFLINSKHKSQHLFALDLCKNYIFINDSKEDNIFLFDIKSKEKLNLTNNFNNNDNVYTLTTITSDEKFIAQNHTKEGVKCLLVELNE